VISLMIPRPAIMIAIAQSLACRLRLQSVQHRSDGFDRHQEDEIAKRRSYEAMMLVKGSRARVDRMNDNSPRPGNIGCRHAAPQRIGEQICPETQSLERDIDGEASNQEQWDAIGHAASQFCGRERSPLLHGRGDRIISNDTARPLGIAHNIGSSGCAFAGECPLLQPMIEGIMDAIGEVGDVMRRSQPFGRIDAIGWHICWPTLRSALPERLSLHELAERRGGSRRRVEHRQELLMLLGIEEEGPLVEDGVLSFATRAFKHEFRQFLPPKRCCTREDSLQSGRGTNLNHVILPRGRPSTRRSLLYHVLPSWIGMGICQFVTTTSVQKSRQKSKATRRQLRFAVLALVAIPTASFSQGSAPSLKQGYWWYETHKPAPETASDPIAKPVIPPMAQLATWTPPQIRALIEKQRDYAATVLTVDAVSDFWRLQDFARRKARAFAGVTQLAMLQHPELNSKSANPMVGDARTELTAQKDAMRRAYLRSHANQFALVMFSRESCGYCRVQWPIIQRFQEETGWQVTLLDLDKRPDIKERFGIEVTPTTMLIRRGSPQRLPIASGVEAFPNLIQTAYQAVRLLLGDIRPEQFLSGPGEEDGFFDALGNGPVASTDPRAAGAQMLLSEQGVAP
jgi:conjugal transfer pilus assembly protein TraF